MNLQALTDEELADHSVAVQIERERRDKLSQIPTTISALAPRYLCPNIVLVLIAWYTIFLVDRKIVESKYPFSI